ncbi:DUF6796 family protein [Tunicatimonas pelagia]|uniref:DUF6796 family protein n=1 Tax=Tunicatimonas pelagia TaxID=931531 RepID=UPI0026654340|nr:DUF6796 family protein [Tunicatimonas pelagia]WKN42966.1 hypothetical protein P0M28_28410 [Tunicatimonas pelagia]
MKSDFHITLSIQSIRLCILIGLFASVTVVVCNTILYSYGNIAFWPQWALNLAYWAGSMVLAFAALGFVPTYFALRPAGQFWAIVTSGFLAYFVALGSVGHGSFFPYYSILQAIEVNPKEKIIEDLLVPIQTYNQFLFLVCILILLLGSVFYSVLILVKPTVYPKWMAFCNPALITLPIYILASTEGIYPPLKIVANGIGFHLGLSSHFLLTYYFLRQSSERGKMRTDIKVSTD